MKAQELPMTDRKQTCVSWLTRPAVEVCQRESLATWMIPRSYAVTDARFILQR